MKRISTLVCILFAAGLANAQIAVDTAANWQQLIPTILGGTCVSISNVTYNAGPGTTGLYTNFPGFGNGILITSGMAVNAVGPNDEAGVTYDNGLPGDALLDTYSNQPTYDATILEFDFVAASSGPVSVEYIFGSDEYLEFVGSFNDIFGFFVSGGNINGVENIALVPGTSVPVSINNINDVSYPQYYVNNDAGLDIEYDGYTTPLTATFQADAGVTYHLKIAIADAGDHILDSGVFLKTYSSNMQTLSGTVTHQGQPAQAGTAELLGFNIDSTVAPVVDVQPILNGGYTFSNVVSGAYNIRITLDTTMYPNTYPAYFDSAYIWSDATIISIPCANYDLGMQLMVLNNGNGTIGGTIGESGEIFKTTEAGSAYVGGHVYLVGVNDNLVYGYKVTDANGNFSFNNIVDGTFKILVDVPGLPMDSIRQVTLNDENRSYTNQSYIVGANKIIVSQTPLLVNENAVIKAVRVAPNPTTGNFILTFNLQTTIKLAIEVVNVAGQKVMDVYNGQMSEGGQVIQSDISALEDGVYFLRMVTSNAGSRVKKLIKTSAN